jgi:hypothetical protein
MKPLLFVFIFGIIFLPVHISAQAILPEYLEPAQQCLSIEDNEQREECYRNVRIVMRTNGEESPLFCERSLPSEFLECADQVVSEGIVSLKQTNDFFEPRVYHGSSGTMCKSTFSNTSSTFSCTDNGKLIYESVCYYSHGEVNCITK